ncbi:Leucine-rich repeat 2 [Corchorus olitorius]|uniref:Leucine-rich repeat 2 n=1 Tax=Corchorus olitorius TaxID=93759 RepID=A0A1R3HGL3_9ROSI|nr:Leucine-rich repeat 2 [Corchorus olitorius]
MSLQLHLPASICFPRLKTLHLKRIRFHQENNPEQLFSACPKLEELFFRWCALISNHYPQKLSISIASLRRLIFHHDTYIVLSINCSILQSLEFLCYKFKLSECNLPSLAEADLHNWDHIHHGLELFERIRHVKSLRLSAQTIEGLIFEYFKMDDSLTLEEVVSFYFNRSLKSLTISKFYGSELEVNVHFHIPDFDSIWRSIKADVRFVGKILENVDVLEKFKMELVNMKVYIMESVHKGQAKQFLLRRL